MPLGNHGELELNGSARFRSEMALAVDNTFINSAMSARRSKCRGSSRTITGSTTPASTWRPTDILSIALVGRNLSDETYKTDGQDFSSVGDIRTVYYGAPRTWQVVFTARY